MSKENRLQARITEHLEGLVDILPAMAILDKVSLHYHEGDTIEYKFLADKIVGVSSPDIRLPLVDRGIYRLADGKIGMLQDRNNGLWGFVFIGDYDNAYNEGRIVAISTTRPLADRYGDRHNLFVDYSLKEKSGKSSSNIVQIVEYIPDFYEIMSEALFEHKYEKEH